jgi:hypoxanthine phosphoribosyltransferase
MNQFPILKRDRAQWSCGGFASLRAYVKILTNRKSFTDGDFMPQLQDSIAKILVTADSIQARTRELGAQISADYAGKDLLLVCILKGGVIFLSDLSRALTIPHAIDFMAISSYGGARTESSGIVRILMDLNTNIENRHVLVVEDIIDTGRTLQYITENLQTRDPASLKICTLLNKPERREVPIHVDYVGFNIPNEFVVGYGLDYGELYRNLPYIGVLKAETYRAEDEARSNPP